MIYTALRHLPWVEPWLDRDPAHAARIIAWLAADTPATASFRESIAGDWPPAPADLAGRAAFLNESPEGILPGWFRAHCPDIYSGVELDAQARRAPLWLRLQTDAPGPVLDELEGKGWPIRRAAFLDTAVRVLAEADVTKTAAFQSGGIEVQDAGSQLVLAAADPAPGGRWLDACAGAGGKTLQLARMVGPGGSVDAHDIRPAALEELRDRAGRAGARNVRILASLSGSPYDGVLVDAPCSGSGTWRRAPHLRWVTTPAGIDSAARLQLRLLVENARRVRRGGTLVYATCSLCLSENERVVEALLGQETDLAPSAPPTRLLPWEHDGDGFFVAVFRRA